MIVHESAVKQKLCAPVASMGYIDGCTCTPSVPVSGDILTYYGITPGPASVILIEWKLFMCSSA